MYTEALRQIRESKARPGGTVGPGQASVPPKRGRKHTPEERRAFYEQRGWTTGAAEVASIDGKALANSAGNGEAGSQGE